ncbi:hypothetical protein RRG08_035117 [Elysia crispata]|uniref:Uncharacterized protein n=1 Tax=Elysia crispata TaxID=231223 RepID=A0AAE1A877_9GAST|nr:hypothetical protein RRG08_035117 [Elysia crispata]
MLDSACTDPILKISNVPELSSAHDRDALNAPCEIGALIPTSPTGDVAKTIECDVLESRIEEESLPVVVESRSSCPADRPGRRTDKTSHARDPCAKDKCLEEF